MELSQRLFIKDKGRDIFIKHFNNSPVIIPMHKTKFLI